MGAFSQLLDHLHYTLICKKAARRLRDRLAAEPLDPGLRRVGEVEPQDLVRGPLSGSQVVGYRVLVEVVGRYWMNRRVVVDHSEVADFALAHPEGRVAVAGENARLMVQRPCVQGIRGSGSAETPRSFDAPGLLKVLADYAQFRGEASDPRRYRFAEYHLHPGDRTLVDGRRGVDGRVGGVPNQVLFLSTMPRSALLEELDNPTEDLLRSMPTLKAQIDR